MAEKPFKDREEAKKQLITCGNWCTICEGLSFLLVIIAIVWRVLKLDYYNLEDITFLKISNFIIF